MDILTYGDFLPEIKPGDVVPDSVNEELSGGKGDD